MNQQPQRFLVERYESRPKSTQIYPSSLYNPIAHHLNTSPGVNYYQPSPILPQETRIERDFSSSLAGSYDYKVPIVYPNSQPFRRDLDRKLTTIQHQEFNLYNSRILVDLPQPQTQKLTSIQQNDDHTCFNICCCIVLMIGLMALALCIYLVLSDQRLAGWRITSKAEESHNFGLVRRFTD